MEYIITFKNEETIIVDDVSKICINEEMSTVELLGKDEELVAVVPTHGLNYIVKTG